MLALALTTAVGQAGIASAWAGDPFPVEESFRGPTFGSQWRYGGSAELTGATEAEGWLRLTSANDGEFGYAYDNEAFPSTDGALVEFEYADWGGSGADGLAFFLFNGATSEAEFHAGQPGGSLGYASCYGSASGLSNAYVGVGFDEYGNFTNLGSICGLDGTEFLPNHVSIRGSSAESYRLLATAPTTESLRAERSQARRVTIAITPTGKLSVYIRYPDGTYQKITEGFKLPAAPEKLKFGYVASTGALTDDHEIRDAQVVKPTQLTPSVTQTAGGHERGKALTWTATVHNEGPNPTQRERVRASTGEQSLGSVSWTCKAAGGAECATATGTGLPNLEAGAMPAGGTLTYVIVGTPTPTSDYAQMTIESEPRGDAGELDPEKERASVKTNLTPLFDQEPSFTLTANGEASATPVPALGGEVSYSYAWQLCETSGTSCSAIAGATATSYRTTAADIDHTIRFTETATNSAGHATVDSAVYKPLPTVTITSAPATYAATREAVLAFVASAAGATLECSLDGAKWSACSSPLSYSDLAEGQHTFSVRAVYGGLSDLAPTSVKWTVESTPPAAPTITSAPPSSTAHTYAAFKFGGLTVNDKLECKLDGGEWEPCTETTEFTGLAGGQHQLQARQVNRAGVDSSVTSFTWKVSTGSSSPSTPASTSTSTPTSKPAAGQPSAAEKLECSLDGKPFVECKSDAEPTGLREGWHTLTVRQVNASGAVVHTTTRKWHVTRKAKKLRHGRRHKPKPKTTRPSAPHKPTHKAHRSVGKPRSGAGKHKPTDTAKTPAPKTTGTTPPRTSPSATTPSETIPPKATHTRKRQTTPTAPATAPASSSAPSSRSHTQATSTEPKSKAKTVSPLAATSQPKQKSPSGASAPAPADRPAGHARKPASHAKPTSPEPPPTAATGNGQPSKSKTPAHSTAPQSKAKHTTPTKAPTTDDKAHAPASKRPARRASGPKTGSGATRLVIRPFRSRSFAVVGRALRLVEHAAGEIAHARSVICVGYTDDLGTRDANRVIGLERARAVCAKLRALGVHAVFKAESRGEEQPSASNATAAGRALNRRVELLIGY